jgi:hypothetical protein
METTNSDQALDALRADVLERFYIPYGLPSLLTKFGELKASLPHTYLQAAEAFEFNIGSVIATVGLPFFLANSAARGSHWQRIYAAERIRARKFGPEPVPEEHREKHALEMASKKMKHYLSSAEGLDAVAADTCQFLLQSLKSPEVNSASSELILQGAVLTWSALEVLSRDVFESFLNSKPAAALDLMKDPVAKQRLQSKFSLDELALFDFNLSSSVGSLLASQQDFSDVRTIRAVLIPMLPAKPAIPATLGDERLWLLCQERHLIVHRRAVVDARYLEATGEKRKAGERLSISPDALDEQLKAVVAAGEALLSSVAGAGA